MITQFKTLFTVQVNHAYYSANCEDINYIIPADTAQLLAKGKLLAKMLNGQLYALFEVDNGGAARSPLPGKTLRFGLQLANPYFTNYTAVAADFATAPLLYRNSVAPGTLDAPQKVTLVGPVFSHDLTDVARPVAVTLKDANGVIMRTDAITAAADRPTVTYNLTGLPPGACTVAEVYPAITKDIAYYVDSELLAAQVFGMVEIKIDSGFYAAPPTFSLAFAARQETLKYYVVATNYSDADFALLSINDAGYTSDGRAQVSFTSVPAASFATDDIAPQFLGDASTKVVLFKSAATVARTDKARTKIQLLKNGEALISNLPQPSQDRTDANLIIPISKP